MYSVICVLANYPLGYSASDRAKRPACLLVRNIYINVPFNFFYNNFLSFYYFTSISLSTCDPYIAKNYSISFLFLYRVSSPRDRRTQLLLPYNYIPIIRYLSKVYKNSISAHYIYPRLIGSIILSYLIAFFRRFLSPYNHYTQILLSRNYILIIRCLSKVP